MYYWLLAKQIKQKPALFKKKPSGEQSAKTVK